MLGLGSMPTVQVGDVMDAIDRMLAQIDRHGRLA
jgi:hypothetical protein